MSEPSRQETACICGLLKSDAVDPSRPVFFEADSETFSLKVSSAVVVENVKCRMCGGHAKTPLQRRLASCRCGALQQWLEDPAVPVEYNTDAVDLFTLKSSRDSALALWFCPVCGGRAPDAIASRSSCAWWKRALQRVQQLVFSP